jgi:carboxypeptidase PM20D1
MAATVRTTVAVTRLEGSTANNVLATSATAIVNMRVAVDWTVGEAVSHVRDIVGPAVRVLVADQSAPSPVSPTGNDERWLAIKTAVAVAYPEAVTVPYIMLAASDARHLARICPAVYRFAPLAMDAAQRAAIHGPNEKVGVESLDKGISFYRALLTGALMGGEA